MNLVAQGFSRAVDGNRARAFVSFSNLGVLLFEMALSIDG